MPEQPDRQARKFDGVLMDGDRNGLDKQARQRARDSGEKV
jgi:hypothetical protein